MHFRGPDNIRSHPKVFLPISNFYQSPFLYFNLISEGISNRDAKLITQLFVLTVNSRAYRHYLIQWS